MTRCLAPLASVLSLLLALVVAQSGDEPIRVGISVDLWRQVAGNLGLN